MSRSRRYLAGFFFSSGVAHLTFAAEFFEAIIPPWVPGTPRVVNQVTGLAEIGGAALALVPGAERPARRYLIALLLAVYPANIHMAASPQDIKGAERIPRWLLWLASPLQFLAIAWVAHSLPADSRA